MLDIDVISHPLRMEKISDHFHIFRRWCSVFTMGRIPSSLILLLTFIEPRFPTFSSLARFSLSSIPGSLSRLDFPFLLMLISMSCVSVHFYHPSFFPSHPAQAQVIFSSPFPIDLFSHFLKCYLPLPFLVGIIPCLLSTSSFFISLHLLSISTLYHLQLQPRWLFG